jgi:aspartate aminotransferase/aminotransferase
MEPSGIRAMFERAAGFKDPCDLSVGQTDFDVPSILREAAKAAIDSGKNRYTVTGGIPPLREALAERLRAEGAPAEDVLVVGGGSAALTLALLALADHTTEVLVADPYFVSYAPLIRLAGATPRFIDTYPDFRLTPERLRAAVTPASRILIVNSPANPTGVALSAAETAALAAAARSLGLQVIADEVYDQFSFDQPHVSWLKYDPSAVLVRAFTKTWGMAGWRIGFAAGPREILTAMATLQQFTFVCAHAPTQWACYEALRTNLDMSEVVAAYRRKRDYAYEALRGTFELHRPEGAFYLFPKAPGGAVAPFIDRCLERQLLVVPGGAFSRRQTHFRLSYSVSEETLKRGVDLLLEIAKRSPE